MTAEVAVMNKLAVALAADSAVTFGDTERRKIYNAANKLFALSKREPIGVMIYGSAELMGVPWETILKMYRDKLGDRVFPRLSDYFEDVIAFLDTNDHFFDKKTQERSVLRNATSMFFLVRNDVVEGIDEVLVKQQKISDSEIAQIVDLVISNYLQRYRDRDFSTGLDEAHHQRLVSTYQAAIRLQIDRVFEKLPLTDQQIDGLIQLGASLACRDVLPEYKSGMVIAGFGHDDHFPCLRAVEMDVRAGDRLHYLVVHEQDISAESGAAIVPFAQRDVVSLFVEGIDSNYEEMLYGFLEKTFAEYPDELQKSLPSLTADDRAAISDRSKRVGAMVIERFRQRTQQYVQGKYVQPMMSVVEALPKSELAALAEAFVNLTSLKRRVSMDLETVGGPVDVAVISKGDGLVWIQRKHYFKPELNHQFFRNYFRAEPSPDRETDAY